MYNSSIDVSIKKFFDYMDSIWIESDEFRWFEGANPWHISNNQGLEGKNKEIKQSHTFRRKLELRELFSTLKRMVEEWSDDDTLLLESSRSAILFNDRNGLKMRTDGYQWFRQNKTGTERILKINPKDKYTVKDSPDLIWSVETSSNKSDKGLKERAKDRIKNREIPTSETFDEYVKMRCSCWIIEQKDDDFYCDCPVGMKGKMCKHTVGLMYRTGLLEESSDVRSVPLGKKRRKGRPKKLPHCLAVSPLHKDTLQSTAYSRAAITTAHKRKTTEDEESSEKKKLTPVLKYIL